MKRTYLDADWPRINASGQSNPPEMPDAVHDFYDGDEVTPKNHSDFWFLKKGAIGKIVGFATKGYVASVEWEKKYMTGSIDHNFTAVSMLNKINK